eukprot:978517-Rhodomonas_salina.3
MARIVKNAMQRLPKLHHVLCQGRASHSAGGRRSQRVYLNMNANPLQKIRHSRCCRGEMMGVGDG